ncbi:MAG TPA: diguanylate cyclase [Pseudoduganella sp.]
MPVSRLGALFSRGQLPLLAALTFCLGIAVTAMLVVYLNDKEEERLRREFSNDTARIVSQTETRLYVHFETLLSLKGLFAANENVNRSQFKRFLDQLDLRNSRPGFQAISFLRYVPETELANYVEAIRLGRGAYAPGNPNFQVKPATHHADHYIIEYAEPEQGNEAAFGLDLAGLPNHREHVELSRDSGKLVATEPVTLVQDPQGEPAFIARVPIYRGGLPLETVAQRRAAFYGLVASVYRAKDLMKEVIDRHLVPHVRVQIFDTGKALDMATSRPYTLLFDSKDAFGIDIPPREVAGLRSKKIMTVGERRWEIQFTALNGVRYGAKYGALAAVALCGAIISFLIAGLLLALGRHRFLSARLSTALNEQRALVDNATVGIEFVRERHIQSCNQAVADMTGYSVGELLGASTRIKYPTEAAFAAVGDAVFAALSAGRSWTGDVEWVRKDGQRIWARLSGRCVVPCKPEQGSIWVSYDITAQKRTDAALLEANEGLARSLAQVERTHRDFTYLSECSGYLQACPTLEDAFECICGYAGKLFPGSVGALYLMDQDKHNLVRQACWGYSALAQASFEANECWALRRGQFNRFEAGYQTLCCPHLGPFDGQVPHSAICLPLVAQAHTFGLLYLEHQYADHDCDADQRFRLAQAWAEDIGLALANLKLRDKLHQQSIRDPLTGLFNRRHMNDVVQREFARAGRNGKMVGVAIVDVDHFKRINDNHGHDEGDVVLKAVAQTVAGHVREGDIACRFGGEEFVVIMPDISLETAIERAEQIRAAISARGYRHGTVTASLGLALFPLHGNDESSVLLAADSALYQAKENGRNRVIAAARLASVAA